MDIAAKKNELRNEFNALSVEKQRAEAVLEEIKARMLQIQGALGAFQLIEQENAPKPEPPAEEKQEPSDGGQ